MTTSYVGWGVLLAAASACGGETRRADASLLDSGVSAESAFAGVQRRGAEAMGVDQYTSTHLFTPRADGGIIELQRDTADAAGIAQIRSHMREIGAAFSAGDFTLPGMVHAQQVPGTDTMRALRARISYRVEDLPRGAQVRIASTDSTAVRAVQAFLAFQRRDHHAGMRHDK